MKTHILSYISFLLVLFFALSGMNEVNAAIPPGYYYFAQNKKKAELKSALRQYGAPVFEFEYGGGPGFTWEGFYYTDRNSDNSVIDMYSDSVRYFNGFAAILNMNIEHSLPKSWWGAFPNGAYKDLFHLYPADGTTNIIKNNLPLGEVTGVPTFFNGKSKVGKNGFEAAYVDNCFEPADEYKGDFARSYLYIATVYENLAPLWQSPMMTNTVWPVWKPWAIDLLLKWNRQDPVSPKEIARNETIYKFQGNRNPFIDYPELAEYIWGKDTTKVFPFPAETAPFFALPRPHTSIDFGVIMRGSVSTNSLYLLGINLLDDVSVSLLRNNQVFSFSSSNITKDQASSGILFPLQFTPQVSGTFRDTLLIFSPQMSDTLRIGLKGIAVDDFVTLEPNEVSPVGGTLRWLADPNAIEYKLNVYQGDQRAGDLMISTYVCGSSWNKAIELYNGTGRPIDLSKYSLQKQSNGSGSFGSTFRLSGTLDNYASLVLVNKQCSNPNLLAKATLLVDTILQFNGNDAVRLLRNGFPIDIVGAADAGADYIWGYQVTLQRKAFVTHPLSVFNENEWDRFPGDSFDMIGNHVMNVASASTFLLKDFSTGTKNEYSIGNLDPESVYTYSVTAIKSNKNDTAFNTMQLHTLLLDAPEISDPSEVRSNHFRANWGNVAYADGYLVDVFKMIGQGDTIVKEEFNLVGTNGKPLPTNWLGTVSGNYTSSTSSGNAVPAVAFKNNGEWLQTNTYPHPVVNLSFMYRFASSSPGSSFLLDGYGLNGWTRIDSFFYNASTSKFYPEYHFSRTQGFKSFRWTYKKVGSGNLSLDDVSVTYGNRDTLFVLHNVKSLKTFLDVDDLQPGFTYYYQVKSTLKNVVSSPSDAMMVETGFADAVNIVENEPLKIFGDKTQLIIQGIHLMDLIQIYSMDGLCLYQNHSGGTEMRIPFSRHGLFIVKVQNSTGNKTRKILH
ncbi:MAG: endonuclease [Microbacter sp.]